MRKLLKGIVFVGTFSATLLMNVSCSVSDKQPYSLTAALNDSVWKSSSWISVVDAPVVSGEVADGSRAADGASWFLATVRNDKKVSRVLWMATGLGVYELYVNGKPVGDEILKPGFTHPEKTRLSFTYDVTGLFDTASGAENVLSAQVTPGWWADKIVTPAGHDGMIGRKCAFRGVLALYYSDGSTRLYGTDTDNWKAGIAGPVTHAAIYDGEEYDARIAPGFETPEKLGVPEINTEFHGDIFPSDGAEIYFRHDLALSPVKTYVWQGVAGEDENHFGRVVLKREYGAGEPIVVNPGENLVVDFGQNCSAVPVFVFNAAEGTELNCVTAELLNDGNGSKERGMDGPEGSVHRLNLRIPDTGMKLKYTFANSPEDVCYTPRYTFFGYRYVSINVTDKVVIKSIKSLPVTSISSDMEIGKIETGNELVNKLISNTIWGQRSNYLSVPTDCPQRNERLGWTADTQVFTETGSFFANTTSFFHKWMRDLIDSQGEKGGFPGVAPLSQYGNEMTRLGMEKYMNHINETRYDHNALIEENGNYQWADWLSYEPLESCGGGAFGPDGPLPEAVEYWNYLSASYWLLDAGMMRDMAIGTGRDASRYETMTRDAKTYIRERFFDENGKFKTDILNTMQTPALFALKNNILDGAAKEAMIGRLRENFAEHGNCLQTGFLGTSILMPTLSENGMSDIAWELLFQRKNPSWIYSIDNGATTIWERWNSYMIDKGMGPKGMNSFNHYAYGVVCEWIWETAAGIASDPANPGFRHIIMKPVPDKRLGYLKAEYHSASGVIRSAWKYEGDNWIWEFSVPDGCTATVTLPGETQSKEYEAGDYKIVQ